MNDSEIEKEIQEIGCKIAFENARDKVWMLEGYLLKQTLYVNQNREA